MTVEGYFANVADSDFFGVLAIVCVLVAVCGLFPKVRARRIHKVMMYLCVLLIPLIHAIGTYFLNLPHA